MIGFVRIINETGAIDAYGDVPDTMLALQARTGMTLLECSPDTVQRTYVNGVTTLWVSAEWLRVALRDKIDREADIFSQQFVSAGATQAMRYQEKLADARAWSDGDNPDDFPFLKEEAARTESTIADVAALIIATWRQWRRIGAKIEGNRIGAKKALDGASDTRDLVGIADIDWSAVIA